MIATGQWRCREGNRQGGLGLHPQGGIGGGDTVVLHGAVHRCRAHTGQVSDRSRPSHRHHRRLGCLWPLIGNHQRMGDPCAGRRRGQGAGWGQGQLRAAAVGIDTAGGAAAKPDIERAIAVEITKPIKAIARPREIGGRGQVVNGKVGATIPILPSIAIDAHVIALPRSRHNIEIAVIVNVTPVGGQVDAGSKGGNGGKGGRSASRRAILA